MVGTGTFALSSAALVATVSSFLLPSQPLHRTGGIVNMARVKLSPSSRQRGRWAMSSVHVDEVGGERYYGPTGKPLLDSVHNPADMKRFTMSELKQLAYELRWETLEVS